MKTAILYGICGALLLLSVNAANARGWGNCSCIGTVYRMPDGPHCRGHLSCPNRKLAVKNPRYTPPPPGNTRILQTPAHPANSPGGMRVLQTPGGRH